MVADGTGVPSLRTPLLSLSLIVVAGCGATGPSASPEAPPRPTVESTPASLAFDVEGGGAGVYPDEAAEIEAPTPVTGPGQGR